MSDHEDESGSSRVRERYYDAWSQRVNGALAALSGNTEAWGRDVYAPGAGNEGVIEEHVYLTEDEYRAVCRAKNAMIEFGD